MQSVSDEEITCVSAYKVATVIIQTVDINLSATIILYLTLQKIKNKDVA